MSQANILIVGAGAMGLINGYYLQQGGAKVTFVVRPGKKDASAPPSLLYNYATNELERFDDYRVVDDFAEVANENFDYAIVTLDHALATAPEATALLAAMGKAFADKETIVIMGGVGIGLREHFLKTTGLPEERILNGCLGLLSHQSHADLPVHAPTDVDKLKQSRMAYKHLGPNSMAVDDSFPEAANKFAEIYARSGKSGCGVVPKVQFAVMTNTAYPMLAALEIAGWPKVTELVANQELWSLTCKATREAASLPELGMGEAAAEQAMTDDHLGSVQVGVEAAALPLDYVAFNRFHHGGKVAEQDIGIMKKCVASGQANNRPMTALREIIDRLEKCRAA